MTARPRRAKCSATAAQPTIATSRVGLLDVGRSVRDIVLGRETGSTLDALASRTEDITAWSMPGRRNVALVRPDHIEHVLVAGHDRYRKAAHYRLLAAVTGNGLLTNEGESWAHQRRLIQPLFGHRQLDHLGAHMTAAATSHLEGWGRFEDGDEIDVAGAMTELTLDVVGRALFGTTLVDAAERLRPAVGMGMDTAPTSRAARRRRLGPRPTEPGPAPRVYGWWLTTPRAPMRRHVSQPQPPPSGGAWSARRRTSPRPDRRSA